MTNTPTNPLVELLIGGTWVDVTADCRLESADSGGGLEIVRGTPNEGNTVEPTQFNFTLNNGASKVTATLGQMGCYSPRNPLGPYYGKLGRNQQVRVSVGRRVDTFNRTVADGWGSVPPATMADGVSQTVAQPWHLTGTGLFYDVAPGLATILGSSGVRLATFGEYADVDIRVKAKISTRDTEFGIVPRLRPTFMTPPSGVDPTFESDNIAGWTSSSGTVSLNTTLPHSGSKAVQVVVTGSPATCSLEPPATTAGMWGGGSVNPNGLYRCRMWVRVTIATTVRVQMACYDTTLTPITPTVFADIAVSANTWTMLDFTGSASQDAAWIRPSATILGSPANGTVMILDDIELYDQSKLYWYTANFVPGATDTVKFGRVTDGISRSSSANLGQQLLVDTWYWMVVQVTGQRFRLKMWKDGDAEPDSWTLTWFDEYTDRQVGSSGEIGVFTAGGTGTVTFASFEARQWRAHTEIAVLPPRWDVARVDRWVPVESRGISRRLGQGRKALRSATSLHLQSYAQYSKGWWSLEESGETAGNNIEGGSPGFQSGISYGNPDTGGAYALPGIAGYASLDSDTSYFIGNLIPHPGTSDEGLLFYNRVPSAVGSSITFLQIYTTGTVRTWRFTLQATNGLLVEGLDRAGNVTVVYNTIYIPDPVGMPVGSWLAFHFRTYQSGGTVNWELVYHRPTFTTFYSISGSYAGTVGAMSSFKFQSGAALTAAGNLIITQIMQFSGFALPFVTNEFYQASAAYIGELSTTRFLRLAANAGVRAGISGSISSATAMGAQTPSKFLELLAECSEVEDGILLEERGAFELTLRTRDSMWNGIRHALNIDSGHLSSPLDPADDDQMTRNDVTINRPDGGFARSIQTTGPLNINPPEDDVDGVGVYDEASTVNVASDAQLQSVADWRRSKGTQSDPRYASVHADLTATVYQNNGRLTAEVMALDAGDQIYLSNSEVSADPTDQMIRSYTELIDLFDLDFTWVSVPSSVYRVGLVGTSTRIGTEGHQTSATFVSGTSQRLNVQLTGAGLPWVYPPDSEESFPFDIDVSGVRLRVISTGDVLNANPDFVTDVVALEPTSANFSFFWDRWDPKRGVASCRVKALAAGTGGVVQHNGYSSVTIPGADYFVAAWIKTEAAATALKLTVDWYQADNTSYISTSSITPVVTVANTWTRLSGVVTAPALGARGRLGYSNVFAAGTRMWINAPRLIPVFSYNANPQILSTEQVPINGVVKTIPIGEAVRLAEPWHVAW